LMYDLSGWNNPGRPASPGAVPAQIYKLVCLRIRTFARSASASRSRSHIKERHKFDRSILSPEALGDRAAAHMSLHLNRQCQRADAFLPPVHLVPGAVCRLVETRTRWRSEPAAAVAVRGHIWVRISPVNGFFQKSRNEFDSLRTARPPSIASIGVEPFTQTECNRAARSLPARCARYGT